MHGLPLAAPEADGLVGGGAAGVKPTVAVGWVEHGAVVGPGAARLTVVPERVTHGDSLFSVFPEPRTFRGLICSAQPVYARR